MFFVRRHIIKVFIPLLSWCFIYFFLEQYHSNKPFVFSDIFYQILTGSVKYHFWFAYIIIWVYIFLPILKKFSTILIYNYKFAIFVFSFWFLLNSISIFFHFPALNSINITYFIGWPGYFLFGHYIINTKNKIKISKRIASFTYFTFSVLTFLFSIILTKLSLSPNDIAFDNFSPSVIISSVAAFILIQEVKIPVSLYRLSAFI